MRLRLGADPEPHSIHAKPRSGLHPPAKHQTSMHLDLILCRTTQPLLPATTSRPPLDPTRNQERANSPQPRLPPALQKTTPHRLGAFLRRSPPSPAPLRERGPRFHRFQPVPRAHRPLARTAPSLPPLPELRPALPPAPSPRDRANGLAPTPRGQQPDSKLPDAPPIRRAIRTAKTTALPMPWLSAQPQVFPQRFGTTFPPLPMLG